MVLEVTQEGLDSSQDVGEFSRQWALSIDGSFDISAHNIDADSENTIGAGHPVLSVLESNSVAV